jgi:chitin disaccharide deacetylase
MMGSENRFLIVNADDFGRSDAVNAGIVEAFRRGILTSASIVAMGAAFEPAVELARQHEGLGIGIHLVLDEHEPALPPAEIPSLVTSDGRFRSRGQQFMKMAADPRMRDDAFREWDAQISKVLASGIKLEHIDGHGHCHAHPRVARLVVALAERYGIAHVRLPVEAVGWRPERASASRFASKLILNSFALCSKRLWDGKLRFPRSFYGFSEGGHVTGSLVRRVGEAAPPGVSELMVHVGNSNIEPAGLETGYDWEGDLGAVTAFGRAAFEEEFGIKLITHTGRRH